MNRRSRRLWLLCVVAVFFVAAVVLPLNVSAHSGRTDANGGHHNRSTGEYHYHHGYPAHQHEDGVCPYDFDDATEHNDSSTTKQAATTNVSRFDDDDDDDDQAKEVSEEDDDDDLFYTALLAVAGAGIIGLVGVPLYKLNKKRRR